MAKIFTFILVIVGIEILLALFGYSMTGSYVLDTLGLTNPDSAADLQSTPLWVEIIRVINLVAGIAVIYIAITNRSISLTPLVAWLAANVLFVFIADMLAIIQLSTDDLIRWIIFLIVAPLAVAYTIALIDWVRSPGSD